MVDLYTANLIIKQRETAEALLDYRIIMDALHEMDISQNTYIREVFCRHYGMKNLYSEEFRDEYFEIMEKMKRKRKITFRICFEKVMGIRGRKELSFSSKLLHTLNPQYPIWDSTVAENHFHMKKPVAGENPAENYTTRYEAYGDTYLTFMRSEEGITLIKLFDEQFPGSMTLCMFSIDV